MVFRTLLQISLHYSDSTSKILIPAKNHENFDANEFIEVPLANKKNGYLLVS